MEKKPQYHLWYLFLALWGVLILHGLWSEMNQVKTLPYSEFLTYLDKGRIEEMTITQDRIFGKIKDPKAGEPAEFSTTRVDPELAGQLSRYRVQFKGVIEDHFLRDLLSWVVPILIFFGIWMLFIGRMAEKSGMGGGLMSIGKSKARVYLEEQIKVSFADVAGVDEAKEELQEVVGFLKNPQKYTSLGGRLPKGTLLVGPPGTGKTLLARAVAGEAGVPFFSISGSEFVEMFVGVGAARVRDLFEQAQQKAPCIIFIDELDALGRARGISPIAGSHDEKEQTLNQLLVEMDGFDPKQGVILLAATNRPEILDQALLRAGRFDRQVLVDRPDKRGRTAILELHMKKVKVDEAVDAEHIAGLTPGFTGADLENVVNEAALLAARRGVAAVQMRDFTAAVERIVAGLEKKNRVMNPKEREVVAYHEMGHAIVAMCTPGTDPVHKVSIIPRGVAALGYTMQRPTEDRYLMTQEELENKMTVLMGGRAAESLVFDHISTGAADDMAKATDIARNMVTRFGMDEKLGIVTYESEPRSFLGHQMPGGFMERKFSEETATQIDNAVKEMTGQAFERALKILRSNRAVLEEAAQKLLKQETLMAEEIEEIRRKLRGQALKDLAEELEGRDDKHASQKPA